MLVLIAVAGRPGPPDPRMAADAPGDPPGQPLGRGRSSSSSNASPSCTRHGGAQFLPPLKERISLRERHPREPLGPGPARRRLGRDPRRRADGDHGPRRGRKHALVCLIPRLIDPKVGRVRIDGHDLRDVTLESIRAQVATVLQADLVFTDSVLVNIGLGDPSYDLPRIIEAAKVAHAHHFIQDLPHGYDTVIGPLGHYLKPDEQYRIALARAYLHDPSIVIIEEPDVPLDDDTKHLIDDTIARLAPGRTLIILPHRLSTIRSCDQVIVLHNGRVESIGPPRRAPDREQALPPPPVPRVQPVRRPARSRPAR